ncbi:MAG: sulfide/dihydroorotate dehydrogenase-like FAD/NAD-binding protein [Candidatus Marinimicrobia bacterium]|jgi:ferredoxin/flavodoxin---NADP+ reductase|nr:sulfide/dihydroorotate dehydrogenase-like FAD/NAD-binding protein [Candidatus Neomarinimicrobiota bacterium]MBT4360595.1 sulfide/dihydroorotate dehydrogenase-like FAD/NAD-binding protein [Candidatus Neomarinimicrobiota bacterium]MBT4715453.1 sulfide/dihydroorotate dehydrogenase-like FAD/NAD-binding protein [Candidatus Neomarinimicrobiota bacterium]MBT4946380.1 sulfide/dihydroorotate dehydrogenase-like FAD/NAD-binding protein [Candidatus Neomarinimicrobiota bacterium]MBT5268841.1 sulfide/dihy
MYKIIKAEFIAPNVKSFILEAPHIAKKRQAGQFIILRVHDKGERIPITIADSNAEEGWINIIVQGLGKTSAHLNTLETGDSLQDLVGPLGLPTHIENWGTLVCMSGGVGTAEALPIAAAGKAAGNRVISIIGARNKDLIIAEDKMAEVVDEVRISTDDGSAGRHGLVTDVLQDLIDEGIKPDMIVAIGPLPMMAAVSNQTKEIGIPTMVSLNAIMVDGTGMCGACRATVGGKTVFVCVDGPEFDGHQVDFKELGSRQKMYKKQEEESHKCFLERQMKKMKAEQMKEEVSA